MSALANNWLPSWLYNPDQQLLAVCTSVLKTSNLTRSRIKLQIPFTILQSREFLTCALLLSWDQQNGLKDCCKDLHFTIFFRPITSWWADGSASFLIKWYCTNVFWLLWPDFLSIQNLTLFFSCCTCVFWCSWAFISCCVVDKSRWWKLTSQSECTCRYIALQLQMTRDKATNKSSRRREMAQQRGKIKAGDKTWRSMENTASKDYMKGCVTRKYIFSSFRVKGPPPCSQSWFVHSPQPPVPEYAIKAKTTLKPQ